MANTLVFLLKKGGVAFALLTFLQQNITVLEIGLATTVNKFIINEFVKLTML